MTYPYLGDFPAGKTIFVPFNTFNSTGASVTLTGLAVTDIEVYKGVSMTQRSSDAGYALVDTDGIDLDTITGIHGFSIDTSDNTDAGFYVAESDYLVVVSAVTIDSQTVNFIAARFSIDNRGLLRPTTATRTVDIASTGEVGLDFNNVNIPVGAIDALCWIDNGTLQSATSTTAVLRSAAAIGDDRINNSVIYIRSGTGAGQSRLITDYVTSTDTATISPAWTVTADNTSVYAILPSPPASTDTAAMPTVLVSSGTGTGQVSVTSGIVASSVSSMGANVITAAATATDFTTEIQTGLATAAALATIDDFLDTEIAAIKAKTDSLTFTVAAELDVNVQSINGATVTGDGNATPWDGV